MYKLGARQFKSIQRRCGAPCMSMKIESILLITGWAHGPETVQPLADRLGTVYDVRILTGAEVLKRRAIPPSDVIITGSMGGLLAIEMLPKRCRKLVLISSTARFCAGPDYPCGTPERMLRLMLRQFRRDPAAVLEAFFRNVHFPHRGRGTSVPSDPAALQELEAGLEYLLESDVRDRVASVNVPVLLLHGREDRIIPSTASEWLHARLPDSTLRIFEHQGHALPAHCFDAVIHEMLAHLHTGK